MRTACSFDGAAKPSPKLIFDLSPVLCPRAGVDAGSVGRGSARAGASRLASPPRMNQTETLRFRLAAAIVTADKQIGPGPCFPNAAGAHVLSLATPKLARSQIAAVHLWVQAFWSKRPGSPGSGGASPYRAGVNKNPGLNPVAPPLGGDRISIPSSPGASCFIRNYCHGRWGASFG